MLGCRPKSKGCLHLRVKCGTQEQLAPSLVSAADFTVPECGINSGVTFSNLWSSVCGTPDRQAAGWAAGRNT